MSAYFPCARRLAIRLRIEQRRAISPAACKFLKTLRANVRLRTITSTFRLAAVKAILEAQRGSPPLTILNQGREVHFTISESPQPRFSSSAFGGLFVLDK